MVFNATFNNISVILWQSVLLVKETAVPGEDHQPATSHLFTCCTHTLCYLGHGLRVCILCDDFHHCCSRVIDLFNMTVCRNSTLPSPIFFKYYKFFLGMLFWGTIYFLTNLLDVLYLFTWSSLIKLSIIYISAAWTVPDINVDEGRKTRSQSSGGSKPAMKKDGTMQKTAVEGKEFVKRGKKSKK